MTDLIVSFKYIYSWTNSNTNFSCMLLQFTNRTVLRRIETSQSSMSLHLEKKSYLLHLKL